MADYTVVVKDTSETEFIEQFTFTYTGQIQPLTGLGRLYLEGPYSVNNIRFTLGVVADRDVILDLRKNGTSIYSNRPRIASGQYTGLGNDAITSPVFAKGDYLTLDVIQSGLTQTGQDLVATLRLKRLF